MEKLAKGRAKITEIGDTLQVAIPGKRTRMATIFGISYGIFLVSGWPIGLYMVLRNLSTDDTFSGFLIIFLVGWILAAPYMLSIIIWVWGRKEKIAISSDTLVIKKQVLGIGKSRRYELHTVQDLRPNSSAETDASHSGFNYWSWGFGFLSEGPGTLAFGYGMKTVDFAKGIDKPEANFILDLFRKMGVNVSQTES